MHASFRVLPLAAAALMASVATLVPAEAKADFLLTWAVGAKGGMNLSLLSEPSEKEIDLSVPGFVGVSGGGGFAGEMMYADFVGLEVDVFYVKTQGQGSVSIDLGQTSFDVDHTLETKELHVPVLLKGQIPFGLVKPFIGAGITFVNQSSATYTTDPESGSTLKGLPQDFNMWTLALGAVVDLPYVRIPIEARGMYQSISSDPRDRTEFEASGNTLTSLSVKPTWEGQIWIMMGIQYNDGLEL